MESIEHNPDINPSATALRTSKIMEVAWVLAAWHWKCKEKKLTFSSSFSIFDQFLHPRQMSGLSTQWTNLVRRPPLQYRRINFLLKSNPEVYMDGFACGSVLQVTSRNRRVVLEFKQQVSNPATHRRPVRRHIGSRVITSLTSINTDAVRCAQGQTFIERSHIHKALQF